jgi:hypothetical protein
MHHQALGSHAREAPGCRPIETNASARRVTVCSGDRLAGVAWLANDTEIRNPSATPIVDILFASRIRKILNNVR